MIFMLIFTPFISGIAAFFINSNVYRRLLLICVSVVELSMCVICWAKPPGSYGELLILDPLGLLVLTVTSVLFVAITVYAYGYLKNEELSENNLKEGSVHMTNLSESLFTACMLFFFASAALVTVSQHFGLLWVAIEATTLATAPLIYFHRQQRSLEATWKYLIICSVGIALALLGNFLLSVAWQSSPDAAVPLTFNTMIRNAGAVNNLWFKIAFIFIFIGYGTKMGLAPMHTWLPDSHSEAPSVVSALLSGALLNCAFLGILRLYRVSVAAGYGDFSKELFVIFGLFSVLVATAFIVGQTSFKRMLAYSSIKHMGVLLLGIGFGGIATYGSMIHLVCHSLTKAAMFLLSGNILAYYGGHTIHKITGISKIMPKTAFLWMAGFLALAGIPPFGIFTSEFTILRGALSDGFGAAPFIYLFCLAMAFMGMASTCLHMVYGEPQDGHLKQVERPVFILPSLFLLAACLILGIYQPVWFRSILKAAQSCITGI